MSVSNGAFIEFGTGDINIFYGGTPGAAMLLMRNAIAPQPIGYEPAKKFLPTTITPLRDDIVISFNAPESIDVMIDCLKKVKAHSFPTNPNE